MVSHKKTILIFIDWFTPGYKAGGPISSNANLIAHLSSEFEFYVITRDTDYCETEPYKNVTSDRWNDTAEGAQVYYLSKKGLSFKNIINIVKKINFDVVYINGIYSPYFSLFPLLYFKYFTRKKVVVSARGMVSDHTFSSKKIKKKFFYLIAYWMRLYHHITIHATNPEEVENIRRTLKFKGEIKIAPNLPPKINPEYCPILKTAGCLNLISIARISKEKNTLFALQMLEQYTSRRINGKNGQITFDIFGTIYDDAYWKECQKVIKRLPATIAVNFKGSIEKIKILETLKNYHMMFMPSLGENYGHSIVESFIAGRPVIISDQTPWRALSSVGSMQQAVSSPVDCQLPTAKSVGWDLPLNKPEEFVKVIEHCVLMEQHEYDIISRNAFEYSQKIINDPKLIEASRMLFAS